jgi:hypothetical protein
VFVLEEGFGAVVSVAEEAGEFVVLGEGEVVDLDEGVFVLLAVLAEGPDGLGGEVLVLCLQLHLN